MLPNALRERVTQPTIRRQVMLRDTDIHHVNRAVAARRVRAALTSAARDTTRAAALLLLIIFLRPAALNAQTATPTPETVGVNESYNYQLTAEGARGNVTWAVYSGSLPPGLNL